MEEVIYKTVPRPFLIGIYLVGFAFFGLLSIWLFESHIKHASSLKKGTFLDQSSSCKWCQCALYSSQAWSIIFVPSISSGKYPNSSVSARFTLSMVKSEFMTLVATLVRSNTVLNFVSHSKNRFSNH
jgi:hypothetical protein